MPEKFGIGFRFVRSNKIWQIKELRLTHDKVILEAADGDIDHVKPDQLRRALSTGDFKQVIAGPNGEVKAVGNDWRDKEDEKSRSERQKREAILKLEAQQVASGKTLAAAEQAILELCQSKGWKPPAQRTRRGWRARVNKHESLLSPQWSNSGNHRQGPDEPLLRAMEEVVKVTLAAGDRFTIAAAWKLIEPKYHEICQREFVPLRRHSKRKLTSYLKTMSWKLLKEAQLDGRTARALTRTAVGVNTADLLWEVVEMDACLLQIFVRNEEGDEIGRPVMYLAVDVATGYPVGLIITIQRASTLPFVDCLRYMFFPKPDGFDKRYGIKNRIEVYGKPFELKVDNGSEFIGEHAVAVTRHLFGDSARCRPYTPEQKPHVERLNGSIQRFVQTLPGATKSTVVEAPRTLSKGETLLTVDELTGRLLRYVYDEFALQLNDSRSWKARKAVAPYDLVAEMKRNFLEPVPVCRDEFERTMYFERTPRTLGHDGIPFDGFLYHSPELARVYQNLGRCSCAVLSTKLDAEMVYVVPPVGETVTANAKELQGLKIDRDSAKKIKRAILENGEELTRRSFQHRLVRLEELKAADLNSSRGRNKKARQDDLLRQARDGIRPSMPGPRTPADASGAASKNWDFAAGSTIGRARGGK